MLDFAKLRDLKCFFILSVFALNLFISKVLDFFFFKGQLYYRYQIAPNGILFSDPSKGLLSSNGKT